MLQTVLPPGAKVGINIAPGHLHAESFKDDMRTFKALLPPDYFQIVLEITERDMLNHREANSLFEWLHNEGFEIAIDDFGTGHSALIYLEHFTMDYLKIDRGFVNAIGTETVTSPVLDAVLTLARRLNMSTVAEGVETPEQAAGCASMGLITCRVTGLAARCRWSSSARGKIRCRLTGNNFTLHVASLIIQLN